MDTLSRVDFRPLMMPDPPTASLRAFQAAVRRGAYGQDVVAPKITATFTVIITIVFVLGFGFGALLIVAGIASPNGKSTSVGIALTISLLVGLLIFVSYARSIPVAWRAWFALAAFAHANGWGMQPNGSCPDYPGMLFHVGHSRRLAARVYRNEPRFFDVSHLTYTTGHGKGETIHRWTYLALKLDRRIPHLVLDGLANNGILGSNLPEVLGRGQILPLEGDFNRHFTLYCPKGYERDALTIFTPDLMALLIDNVEAFDVEIVDDWLFIYSSRSLPLNEPQMWARLISIIDTVGAKTLSRTARYRDERLVPTDTPPLQRMASTRNLVAPPGQRVHTRGRWKLATAIAVASAFVVVVVALAAIGW